MREVSSAGGAPPQWRVMECRNAKNAPLEWRAPGI